MAGDDDFRGFLPASAEPLDEYGDFRPAGTQPLPEAGGVPLRDVPAAASADDSALAQWMAPLRRVGLDTGDATVAPVAPPSSPAPQREVGALDTLKRTGEAGLRRAWAGVLTTGGALAEAQGQAGPAAMGEGLLYAPPELLNQPPVYGAGDPLMAAADRQNDLARQADIQKNEKAPFLPALIGGASNVLAAPFAPQQAATAQLRRGADAVQAIKAAGAEIPASAIAIAAPELGGRLGGGLADSALARFGGQYAGALLPRVAANTAGKVVGGGLSDVVAEPLATIVRNSGLSADQRQPMAVTPQGLGASAVLGGLARGPGEAAPGALRGLQGPAGGAPDVQIPLRGGMADVVQDAAPASQQAVVGVRGLAEPPPEVERPPPLGDAVPDNAPRNEGLVVSGDEDRSEKPVGENAPTEGIGLRTDVEPQDPTAYSVAYEHRLDPADRGKSREVHERLANEALHGDLEKYNDLEGYMESLIPGIGASVSPVGGRETPQGWTWEHASTSTAFGEKGVMRLVPDAQHTPGSPWWRVFHPDKGAAGGYSEWAIPAGAPPNKRRNR